MSAYEKLLIAVDPDYTPDLSGNSKALAFLQTFDEKRPITTPDITYHMYIWDWHDTGREDDGCRELLAELTNCRHAIMHIYEDGKVCRDIVSSDKYGIDEEFEEILGFYVMPTLWDDVREPIMTESETKLFLPPDTIEAAVQCLADNGVEPDEAETVLQALVEILLNVELATGK